MSGGRTNDANRIQLRAGERTDRGRSRDAPDSQLETRTAVYGASSISTGLTNNFWVDSFFLPLMLSLLGIWMWKSGMFLGLEKWLGNQKKKSKFYGAQKELNARIAKIQKTETAK